MGKIVGDTFCPKYQVCSTCGVEKEISKFNRDNRLKRGYTAQCKECRNAQNRKYYWSEQGKEVREKNAENTRGWRYLRDYGITTEDYERMLDSQYGRCAICEEEGDRRLDVDHNHVTKEVRGLLCHPCNKALGMFKDDPDVLEKAVI